MNLLNGERQIDKGSTKANSQFNSKLIVDPFGALQMVTLNLFFGSESFIIAEKDFFLSDPKNWANLRRPRSVDLFGAIKLFTLS